MIFHKYVISKSSWGIIINFYGDIYNYSDFRKNLSDKTKLFYISDKVHLLFKPEKLSENQYINMCSDDYPFIADGISRVSELIEENSPFDDTLIVFNELVYSVCDFQEEGLTAGAMEWSAKAFGFECPEVNAGFDKVSNRYIFDF